MTKLITTLMFLVVALAACATAPSTTEARDNLKSRALATVQEMTARDPGLQDLLDHSAGYAVFPDIGKAGVVVGGAYGRGVLFEHGGSSGYVSLTEGSIGAQLGGQTISELIVFHDRFEVDHLKAGSFQLGADASAVAITTGAAAAARFTDGVAVFALPRGGLMAEISVSGQKLNYQGG